MKDAKDSKTLMPEVLPAPGSTPSSDPRARVTERLEKILRSSVGMGATAVAMSCAACDPLPPPADAALDSGASPRRDGAMDGRDANGTDALSTDATDELAFDAPADVTADAPAELDVTATETGIDASADAGADASTDADAGDGGGG